MGQSFFNKMALCVIVSQLIIGCNKRDISDISSKEDLIMELAAELDEEEMTSMAFAVIKNDSLILNDALGYANTSNNKAATPETRYLIASISKTITCVALMQLFEQNLFTLDDDIGNYLPFPVRNPNYPDKKITFRMLLAHTSSISDKHQNDLDLDCYGSDCIMSLSTYFDNIFSPGGQYFSLDNFSNSEPGTEEDYSNLGLALVGYLVEQIASQPFDVYCKNNIFQSLGMTKTEWRLADTPQDQLAVPYSPDIIGSNPHYTFPDYPNGGLRTTVVDLSKFLRAIMLNGTFNGTTILSPSTVNLIRTLQFESPDQALTFYYNTFNGKRVFGHSGGEKGVTTEMYFNPDNNIGVIIFNNDDDTNLNDSISLLFSYGENN